MPEITIDPETGLTMYDGSSTPPADMVPGMSGGSYNPNTGERTRFALPPQVRPPLRPPDTMGSYGMQNFDQDAIAENIKNFGVEQAVKGIEAAISFQGQRGAAEMMKNGATEAQAWARFGSMILARQPRDYATKLYHDQQNELLKQRIAAAAAQNQQQNKLARDRFEAQERVRKEGVIRGNNKGLYRIKPGSNTPETLISPPPQREPTPFSLTTGSTEEGKLTQRLTETQNNARLAAIAEGKIKPLLAEYQDHQSELKSGDTRYIGNLFSRKSRMDDLKVEIEALGGKVPDAKLPAASAPASASTGLPEGQRVRSRVTGKFGTVKNGIVVPDPEAAQ